MVSFELWEKSYMCVWDWIPTSLKWIKNLLVISLKMYFFSGSLLPEIKQIHLEQKLLNILEEQQFALVNLHINTDLILT